MQPQSRPPIIVLCVLIGGKRYILIEGMSLGHFHVSIFLWSPQNAIVIIVHRLIGQALSADEKDEWMNALELYSKSLSVIRSGLAVLQSSVGAELADGSSIHELRGKMEK